MRWGYGWGVSWRGGRCLSWCDGNGACRRYGWSDGRGVSWRSSWCHGWCDGSRIGRRSSWCHGWRGSWSPGRCSGWSDCRGQGWGGRLFQVSLEQLAHQFSGLSSCILLVNERWHHARRIYDSLGFQRLGSLPKFFRPNGETPSDGLVCRRLLPLSSGS